MQKVKAEYANQKKPIDYVVMGHFHQYISLKDAIVNGSIKGYDEYALSGRFAYEKPQQALWFTHPTYGITFQVPVQSEPHVAKNLRNRGYLGVSKGLHLPPCYGILIDY